MRMNNEMEMIWKEAVHGLFQDTLPVFACLADKYDEKSQPR